ncbi:hypothetical protein HDU86_007570 [Geranomyces michiganensis]|nr:hypothetical protein HDU86_007570 [Geranomyces michiganensis]
MKALGTILCAGTLLLGIVQGDSIQNVFDTMNKGPTMRAKRAPVDKAVVGEINEMITYLGSYLNASDSFYLYSSDGGTLRHDDYEIRYTMVARKPIPKAKALKDLPSIKAQLVDGATGDTNLTSAYSNSLYVEYRTGSMLEDPTTLGKEPVKNSKSSKHKLKSGKEFKHNPQKDFRHDGVIYHPVHANNRWTKLNLYNESKPGDYTHDNTNKEDLLDLDTHHASRKHMYRNATHMAYNPDGYLLPVNSSSPRIKSRDTRYYQYDLV